jgi:hypothetical protein
VSKVANFLTTAGDAMRAKFHRPRAALLALAAAAAPLAGGCLSNDYRATHTAMRCTDLSPVPIPQRSKVYLFMMNGADVFELGGMTTLRDKLAEAGFAKVYYTQTEDHDYYRREMARLQRDEPGARMILLGYGTAAAETLRLAAEACKRGESLDAVVFLDPVGLTGNVASAIPVPSVTLRSHNWPAGKELVTSETVVLAGVGHVSAPTAPATVNALVELMTAAATKVVVEDIRLTLPYLPLRDKPDVTPRGIDPATLFEPTGAWEGFPAMPERLPKVPKAVAPPPAVPGANPAPEPTPGKLPAPRPVPAAELPKRVGPVQYPLPTYPAAFGL